MQFHFCRINLPSRFIAAVAAMCLLTQPSKAQSGRIEVDIRDETTGNPVPAIMQIIAPNGSPVRAVGATYRDGWNLIDGTMKYRGRPGDYRYQVIHGPEFSRGRGGFTLDKGAGTVDILELPRHANMAEEGWYGGDTLCLESAKKTKPWLSAVGLEAAACLVSSIADAAAAENEVDASGPWAEQSGYVDRRSAGGLAFHHWMPPAEVPLGLPSTRLLVMSKQGGAGEATHNTIYRLWQRDVPIWLASGKVDSIALLSEHLTEGKAARFDPFYDPDPGRFIGKLGPGKMVEHIYWQVLEAGLRLPPSAGSGFGKDSRMVGYNRVYANLASPTREAWWAAVAQGRSLVTNGPLLRAKVNGHLPGTTFSLSAGKKLQLDVTARLTVSDPVDYLDVVFNGEQIYQARLDEYAKQGGRIPLLEVGESGWLVVRVVTGVGETYRFASTAPFYFEIEQQPRISKQAVEMFVDWLDKAQEAVRAQSGDAWAAEKPYMDAARKFWLKRLQEANCP